MQKNKLCSGYDRLEIYGVTCEEHRPLILSSWGLWFVLDADKV